MLQLCYSDCSKYNLAERIFLIDLYGKIGNIQFLGKDAYTLYIQSTCGSVTDTVEILDLYYYDSLTSDKGNWTNWSQTGATRSFTNNGLSISGTNVGSASTHTRQSKLNITYPSNYSVEYEIVALNRTYDDYIVELGIEGVGLNSNSSKKFLFQLNKWSQTVTEYNGSLNVGDIVRWEYINGTVSLYVNNVLIGSKSRNTNYNGFVINQYQSRGITFKNLIIHEL